MPDTKQTVLEQAVADGRFREELKDISLQFRGSRNQRVIDMNETRRTGVITRWAKLRK